MTPVQLRGVRYVLLTILGGLFLLLGCLCAIAGLLWGACLFLASLFFPGASWNGLTEDIVYWVISLVALFGLSRLSYAWASDGKTVPPAESDRDAKV